MVTETRVTEPGRDETGYEPYKIFSLGGRICLFTAQVDDQIVVPMPFV